MITLSIFTPELPTINANSPASAGLSFWQNFPVYFQFFPAVCHTELVGMGELNTLIL